MSPADILAIALGATAGLYASFYVVGRLAAGVIRAIDRVTRFERP